MKHFRLLAILLSVSTTIFAQDTASVLFIGNSYTYVNNMPVILDSISSSLGDHVDYDSQTPGGYTFQSHAGNALTYSKINSNAWDYVVLQAQSQEPSFPDAQVNSGTIPYAQQIADSVYANNFCSEVLMFMTWGRENGDPQWAPISTFEGMNDRLRDAYLRMADTVQGSVSPVGSAWIYVRENFPTINLYTGDGSHPSLEGSYLAACTFYASVFRKSPIGASFTSGLSAGVAANLQEAASIAVLDSIDLWNLRPISEHTQAIFSFVHNDPSVSFNNQSTKATNYYWSFGDSGTSIEENPTHIYASNGTYTVQLIAESPCDTDTTTFQVTIGSLSLFDNEVTKVKLKSFDNSQYIIDGEFDSMQVFNAKGQKMDVVFNNNEIDLSGQENGIYLCKVEVDGQILTLKIPVYSN